MLSAGEALDWGLINQVVAADKLTDTAGTLAGKLADGPTEALGAVKKLLLMSANDSLESQMERETRSISSLGHTSDGREGIDAFVNKRKPKFTGK